MPCWLKLERSGDTFAASASRDNGSTWFDIEHVTVPMNSTIFAGIAGCSNSSDAFASIKAALDHVSIESKSGAH